MKNHGFKSVFEVCAALLAQYIAFFMISSRLGKEAEIENLLTNKFVKIFCVIYLILMQLKEWEINHYHTIQLLKKQHI